MIKAFKAFDKDFRCRGFQFEIEKTFEEKEASLCNSGFHACENPLDVLSYYDLIDSRFAVVDLDETEETHKNDTKRVGKKIHIKAELNLKDFIKASVEYLFYNTKTKKNIDDRDRLASSGDYTQLASSGNSAILMCAGINGRAKAKKGSWITLSEWEVKEGKLIPACVKTEQIDGERIKEDVYYKLENGKFVECE